MKSSQRKKFDGVWSPTNQALYLLSKKTNDEAFDIMVNRSFMFNILENEFSNRIEKLSKLPVKKITSDISIILGELASVKNQISNAYIPSIEVIMQSQRELIMKCGEEDLVRDDDNFKNLWIASLESISNACGELNIIDVKIPAHIRAEFEPINMLLSRMINMPMC